MKFFRLAPIPEKHRRNRFAHQARWLMWGDAITDFFDAFGDKVDRLVMPHKILVRGCAPYDCSYSYALSHIDKRLSKELLYLSESLLSFPIRERLNLLTGMLEPPVTSPRLQKLFALLRAGIVRLTGNPKCALNAPVYAERCDEGFLLHADLFMTERLWLIFDNVPSGPSGASLFLPMKMLFRIVADIPKMPIEACCRLHSLTERRTGRDSFDEFYKLLYSDDQSWYDEIRRALNSSQHRIKLRRGEGYFLDDRFWLHGREPVGGNVSASRFRRLVFGLLSCVSHENAALAKTQLNNE